MHKSKEYKYLLLCAARVKNKKPVNLKQNTRTWTAVVASLISHVRLLDCDFAQCKGLDLVLALVGMIHQTLPSFFFSFFASS